MKDYETFPPLSIDKAKGDYLYLEDGRKIIDSISSWWCKSLGHGNERIKNAVTKQMERFEHVILANTTNREVQSFADNISSLMPGLDTIFFGGDGSMAIEIAVKMALHATKLRGENRSKFAALKNGYHGETALALSLSDLGIYKDHYRELLHDIEFIEPMPYVTGKNDPLWKDASAAWSEIEPKLDAMKDELCGILFEPVIQGAGGMLIYSPDLLVRLRKWADENGVYLIADEIMTGFGRTGEALGCNHGGITPDFCCLSKGLTGGWMAMSICVTSRKIYDLFYGEYGTGKDFLHSNTFAGSALAVAAANEAMAIYREEGIFERVRDELEPHLINSMNEVAERTGLLKNIRGLGAVVAADLDLKPEMKKSRVGYAIFKEAVSRGALLRPLGNTVYWFPPLNVDLKTLGILKEITIDSIKAVLG